jgi:hypothetical protein
MDNRIFFGDTSGTLNGPYKPAKIDRNFNNNAGIGAFKFETPPNNNTNGDVFVIHGNVFTPTSPAYGAVVSVQIVDKDNLADTTLALTTTVNNDSTWTIDLGNAITDTSGTTQRLYQHKEGDILLVTVTADKNDGYTRFTTTRAAVSPQEVNQGATGTLLSPVVDYDLRIKDGLNLIGIPVNLFATEPQSAEQFLEELAAGKPTITRYVTTTSTLETILRQITADSTQQYIGANDWNLADADGNYYIAYFVSADADEYVTLSGSVYGEDLAPMTFTSAGQYWIARPAQISSLFYAWSARTVLANVLNAETISRYNEVTQQYQDAVITAEGKFSAETDFHIDPSEGYVLQISAASQWDINTPNEVLLANASQKFDNVSGVDASLTLDVSKSVTSQTASNVKLSDVTSAAAKISWMGATTGAIVRFGKASQGMTHYINYNPTEGVDGVGVQMLTGLKADTEYIYEIVINGVTYNNNGKPFSFTTSKIGIGTPYSVYGRLVDENGDPLKGAIVYLDSKNGDDALSQTIAATTDEDGYWLANLANLKMDNGTVYQWNKGDELRVTAVYGSASTSFRTLVTGDSPQNVVRISDTDGTASQDKDQVARVNLPKAFALGQNYPNPFNPSTTIAYDIPDTETSAVSVQLKVYNVRGQVVKALVDEAKDAGHYVVQWDGRNEKGETVSSGVYFYRIKAGSFVTTRKMVLLK